MDVINKVKLSNIADLITKGTTPTTLGYNFQSSGINFLKIECFDENGSYLKEKVAYISEECNDKLKRSQLKKGDILFSIAGAIGRVAIVTGEMLPANTNQALAIIRITDDNIHLPYIKLILTSPIIKKQFEKKKQGVAQLNLSLKDIGDLEIPLIKKEQQIEIVKLFSKISSVINYRKQQLQQLDELVKARFVELMNSNPSHNFLSDFIVSYKAERCGDRELPVLSITKDDGIVLQNEKFKKRIASSDASTYKIVPRGKLVQGIHIDERNFAIQNIVDEGIVSPAYKIWTVDTTKAIPEVLAFALRTDRTMSYISSKFTGSIKRRESISISDFMATPIDLPNMIVQNEFAAFVEQTDKSKFMSITVKLLQSLKGEIL